jgi:hypothetical protein
MQANPLGAWDLLLDKGTFDAIALGEKDAAGKSPAAGYPDRVARLLKPGGFFLITCEIPLPRWISHSKLGLVACNFTEDELKATFTSSLVCQCVGFSLMLVNAVTAQQFSNTARNVHVWW